MTDKITEARRSAFQQAMNARNKTVGQWLDGKYQNPYAQAAWEGYNAAFDSVVVELPDRIDNMGCTHVIEACTRAIHAAGVRTK